MTRAASGEEILIAKNGKPVARLTRLSNRKSAALIGAFAGKIHSRFSIRRLAEYASFCHPALYAFVRSRCTPWLA